MKVSMVAKINILGIGGILLIREFCGLMNT
jgi:hypothetical protein